MTFKQFMENQGPDPATLYPEIEKKILNDPVAQQELKQNFEVSRQTVRRIMGTDYALVYITSVFNRQHGSTLNAAKAREAKEKAAQAAIPPDPYLYHVTTKKKLRTIARQGLIPDMPSMFSNYKSYSQGKIFLCPKEAVSFWKARVEDHEQHNNERTSSIVVLRIPKEAVPNLQPDEIGTTDSRQPSFYTTTPIPKTHIQVV